MQAKDTLKQHIDLMESKGSGLLGMSMYINTVIFSHYESSNETIKKLEFVIKLTKEDCTLNCDTF